MTLTALFLVLLAAVTHASWNISAKFAAESRHFVWLFSAGSVLVYGPIVVGIVLVEQPDFGARHWLALAATSVLHLLYSISLQTGYRHSDLSVVYPIARGLGVERVLEVNLAVTGSLLPDRTFLLVVPGEVAARRRGTSPDRIESEGDEFAAEVDRAYREIAEIFSQRVVVVDGTAKPGALADEIHGHLRDLP